MSPRNPEFDYTPSFAEVVRTLIERRLSEVHVCLPAKIVSYDKDTQKASVQVQLQKRYEDDSLVIIPVIPNVPVIHPKANGGKVFIHLPLKAGDDVTLVFCERSLDNWKTQGGMTDPADRRKFSMTDAYALIGGSAFPDAFKPTTSDSVEIVNDQSKTIIHPDGTYNLYGGNGDDFIQVLNDFILGVQRAYTETWDGPEPLIDDEDPGWLIIQERCQAFVNGSDPYGGI